MKVQVSATVDVQELPRHGVTAAIAAALAAATGGQVLRASVRHQRVINADRPSVVVVEVWDPSHGARHF